MLPAIAASHRWRVSEWRQHHDLRGTVGVRQRSEPRLATPSSERRARVTEMLESCFITDVAGRLCGHLSRGYRQRVGLAQAILHKPDVVILDEPTSGLDPRQIIDIRKLIRSLAEKHTVILSTHILPEVTMVCDKVVIINKGKTVLEERLDELQGQRSLEEVFVSCLGEDVVAQAEEAVEQ